MLNRESKILMKEKTGQNHYQKKRDNSRTLGENLGSYKRASERYSDERYVYVVQEIYYIR
jgi:hypothetical protein